MLTGWWAVLMYLGLHIRLKAEYSARKPQAQFITPCYGSSNRSIRYDWSMIVQNRINIKLYHHHSWSHNSLKFSVAFFVFFFVCQQNAYQHQCFKSWWLHLLEIWLQLSSFHAHISKRGTQYSAETISSNIQLNMPP